MVSLVNMIQNNNNIDNKAAKKLAALNKFQRKLQNPDNRELPAALVKHEFIQKFAENQALIIVGETGSGKTTLIPRFIYEYYATRNFVNNFRTDKPLTKRVIAVTQPRRVAATSVAERVSKELNTKVGDLVGYSIRFDDQTSPNTRIKYMTDGILLREAIEDPTLSRYAVIILDEAHERSIQTDILFGIIQKALVTRRKTKTPAEDGVFPLKVIVMSATMDVDHFSKYFYGAPVFGVMGRTHKVEILYAQERITDYVEAALITVFKIHKSEHEISREMPIGGDIIVFCTGQDEIEGMVKTVEDLSHEISQYRTPSGITKSLKPLALYSALSIGTQRKVFHRPVEDCFRRVIFATNVAETSITIPNIRFVVDTGKVKSKVFSSQTNYETMLVENISQAQATQRSGRAGRIAPGKCYRLYTEEQFEQLAEYPVPEILKCNLSTVILQMIGMGIEDILKFEFLDRPSKENLSSSIQTLSQMKAIERHVIGDRTVMKLTELATKLIAFPVDVKLSAVIVAAEKYGCLEEVLIIVSMLSVDHVFISTTKNREELLRAHKKFSSTEGDLIKLLNIYRKFREANLNPSWCYEHFLRREQLLKAVDIRKQLRDICLKLNMNMSSKTDTEIIRKCFTFGAGLGVGLGANIAVLQKDGDYKILCLNKNSSNSYDAEQTVHIHPSSCLFEGTSKPECVLFVELVHTTKTYMRTVTLANLTWFTQN